MSKNILIFTTRGDYCVGSIIENINSKGFKGIRVNTEDLFLENFKFSIDIVNSEDEELLEVLFGVKGVHSIWFRRLDFSFRVGDVKFFNTFDLGVYNFILVERQKMKQYVFDRLERLNITKLGSFRINKSINKLDVLRKAKEFGLNVPKTFVSNNIDLIKTQLDSKFITKAIYEAPRLRKDNKDFMGYTALVDNFTEINENIDISLFQNHIEAVIEIRTIYFNGIFNTVGYYVKNENRIPDIRYYFNNEEVRSFPMTLDKVIMNRLTKVLSYYKLDFACIDLCLGKDGLIYFFELNPGGSFMGLSDKFNFGIGEKIANYLC